MSQPRLREMRCEVSFLKNADGGCSYSQGSTAVWASCSGPGDVHVSRSNEECMTVDVSFRGNYGDNKFHPLNNIITSTVSRVINLELFPHTCLVITVHGLQDDGSMGAAALNATCFALLDNGIPFKSIFCGVVVVRVNGALIVDPTLKQEKSSDAQILFSIIPSSKNVPEVCGMDSVGSLTVEELDAAWQLASASASNIFEFYRSTMKKKHSIDQQ
ncbi:unnamed protein product [Caenorhabditis bovis]|uniref:Uncharacterized protein n=1 Tax=Caenorhabditis bovis TaxID=2654633 RepID=A0A8S1FAR6_9PELO|nr:unnamed protein product [Caenorhabditis bovis]